MNKVKKVVTPEVVVPAECLACKQYAQNNAALQDTANKYKAAYTTLKMKLETIFNITQM